MDFSSIPSVDRVLGDPAVATLLAAHGHSRVTAAIREQLEGIRESLRSGEECPADMATVVAGVASLITNDDADAFKTLLNLTGTVLHTNLGRALLPPSAIEAVARVAGSNSNLEFDLENGRRGDRDDHIEALIQRITGAEAATVVNNNAAAVMLALNALAFDREVPVSRGELVEIGGSFRIPDIMARSGTRLVEVGATNRTHLADYENAIREETVLLLKVHTSNYEITGFTKSVTEAELAELGRKHNLPLMTDLGSGTLINLEQFGLPHETTVQDMIEAGADVVTFSGDKLLGGPQAGIIAGRKDLIARIKSNPMKRAMRVDKMTLAALQAVLKLYLTPEKLVSDVPTIRQLARSRGKAGAARVQCRCRGCAQPDRQRRAAHERDSQCRACPSPR